MKTIRTVIITGPRFEDIEVMYPYYRLSEAGYSVDVVTSSDAEVVGKYGIPMKPTIRSSDLKSNRYDLVVIPGGTEAPDRVRQVPSLVSFVKEMYTSGKIVSSICHGPWVLIEAEIVKGKKATCYQGMKTDLKNAGAFYKAEPVVIDGNLITGDHPRNLGRWMKETIELVEKMRNG